MITRTGSMASWVPPALTTTVRPARSPSLPSRALMWPTSWGTSTKRPMPTSPDARCPLAGPTKRMPLDFSFSMLSWVAWFSYMCPSMAGAISTGAWVARMVVVRGSSANPHAALAMKWAVAGATTTMSALPASWTCSMLSSESGSNTSTVTGRWVRLRKARGATNWVAP